jgi:adenylate cyclase
VAKTCGFVQPAGDNLRYNRFVPPNGRDNRDFRLEDWLVQPSLGRITGPVGEVQLEPRAMELLGYLAEHSGGVVSRQQILDDVWQQEFVDDGTLTSTIARLRKALGDDARNPRYIETLSKRGYRLLPRPVDMLEIVADPGGAFRVGDWLVEPGRNRMSRGAATVALEHNAMDVLLLLAERAGQPVAGSELGSFLGRRGEPSGEAVDRSIAELRQALGAEADGPAYIEEGPENAYRLAAAVGFAEPGATVARFPGVLAALERPVFVGREDELARLDESVRQVVAGDGKITFVSGEAGTGKTALIGELAHRAGASHPELVIAAAECSAQIGVGDAFAPWRTILGLLTGDLGSAGAAAAMMSGLDPRLRAVAPVAAEAVAESGRDLVGTLIPGRALLQRARGAEPHAAWLPGLSELVERKAALPPDPTLQQGAVFMQVVRVLQATANRRPLLLVLDDLHWADAGSIALLFHAARELVGHRILIVGSYRPTDVALGRGGGRHPLEPVISELRGRVGQLTVELGQSGDRGFVDALVDSEPNELGEAFREALYRQTAGHALFTVETLRTLQDRGLLVRDPRGRWVEGGRLDWSALPERVEGVLAARVERLDEGLSQLLRIAAVEGEDFSAEVVARVAGADPRETLRLLSRELATRHRLVRARGVRAAGAARLSSFGFSHVLFQRYLYGSLDEVERVRLHEDMADALEALHGDDTEEISVQLARHLERAGLTARAVQSLLQAGTRATRMTANQEAVGHLTRALELLATLPESDDRDRTELALQLAIQVPLMSTVGWAGHEVSRALERARELAERVGDDSQKGWLLYLTGSFLTNGGRMPESEEVGRKLEILANRVDDDVFRLFSHFYKGYCWAYTGRCDDGRAEFEQVLEQFDRSRHHWVIHVAGLDHEVMATGHLSWLLARMGHLDRAMECLELCREISERVGHFLGSCMPPAMGFYCHFHRHELGRAARCAEDALAIATEHGYVPWAMWARTWLGMAAVARGDFADGVARIELELGGLRHIGLEFGRIIHQCSLAEGRLGCGRVVETLATLDEAARELEVHGECFWEPELHRVRGEALRAAGNPSGAEACFIDAVEVARGQGAGTFELQAAMGLARLRRDQDRRDEARDGLKPVVAWFTEGLDTPLLVAAKDLLDELVGVAQKEQRRPS